VKLSPTGRAALRALRDHGGEGVITRTGTILAAGEELSHDDDDPDAQKFDSRTWLRLFAEGLLEGKGDARVRLTTKGFAEAKV
jgi:hypothetical protein